MTVLSAETDINIRFSDTDAMGVVWHGNYLRFFEDAREEFGKQKGIAYLTMYENGFFVPIVRSQIDHKAPLYYGQEAKVIIRLIPDRAAKIIFEYEIMNTTTGQLAAVGNTVQVFLSATDRSLSLYKPDFYSAWEKSVGINF